LLFVRFSWFSIIPDVPQCRHGICVVVVRGSQWLTFPVYRVCYKPAKPTASFSHFRTASSTSSTSSEPNAGTYPSPDGGACHASALAFAHAFTIIRGRW